MYCHQEHDAVFFTRFMGDFTARPPGFDALKARRGRQQRAGRQGLGGGWRHTLDGAHTVRAQRTKRQRRGARHTPPPPPKPTLANPACPASQAKAAAREVFHLPEVGGYFDDQEHYDYIKSLCSYTHPSLTGPDAGGGGGGGAAPRAAGSLEQLKRQVAERVKLHFCDLCLTGRKVCGAAQRGGARPGGCRQTSLSGMRRSSRAPALSRAQPPAVSAAARPPPAACTAARPPPGTTPSHPAPRRPARPSPGVHQRAAAVQQARPGAPQPHRGRRRPARGERLQGPPALPLLPQPLL